MRLSKPLIVPPRVLGSVYQAIYSANRAHNRYNISAQSLEHSCIISTFAILAVLHILCYTTNQRKHNGAPPCWPKVRYRHSGVVEQHRMHMHTSLGPRCEVFEAAFFPVMMRDIRRTGARLMPGGSGMDQAVASFSCDICAGTLSAHLIPPTEVYRTIVQSTGCEPFSCVTSPHDRIRYPGSPAHAHARAQSSSLNPCAVIFTVTRRAGYRRRVVPDASSSQSGAISKSDRRTMEWRCEQN